MCPYLTPDETQRFWSRVDRSGGPDACWDWTAGRKENGYGSFTVWHDGRSHPLYAHRVAWELTHGPIPDGLIVCHRCDRPPCCNADRHLFLGTHKDNSQDATRKQRMGKLTALEVLEMRESAAAGVGLDELALRFRVAPSTAGYVVSGETFAHLPGALGSRSHQRLSDEDIAAIHALAGRLSQAEIARRFGISDGYVSTLLQGNARRPAGIPDDRLHVARHRLTQEDAEEIRPLRKTMTYDEIAKRFGVSRSLVSQVLSGKVWRQTDH